MILDNNNCDRCSITKFDIVIRESVGDPDSKDACYTVDLVLNVAAPEMWPQVQILKFLAP